MYLLKATKFIKMKELLSQHGFTAVEIEEFASHALVIKCSKRTTLLREGEIPRFFYWAIKGIFRAGYTTREGNDITRAFFSPDTIPFVISYSSLISQTPSLSFLESIEDGVLLSLPYEYLRKLEDSDVRWTRFFKSQLDKVFLLRDLKEWQFYTLSADELYLAFVESSPTIAYSIPQHYIASYIGISPEALSRIKKRLQSHKKK